MAAFSEHNPASQHAILHSVCEPNAARNMAQEWTQAQLLQRCTVLCGAAPVEPRSIGMTLRSKLLKKELVSYREVGKTRIWFATKTARFRRRFARAAGRLSWFAAAPQGREHAVELLRFAHDPKAAESYLRAVNPRRRKRKQRRPLRLQRRPRLASPARATAAAGSCSAATRCVSRRATRTTTMTTTTPPEFPCQHDIASALPV
jgi:hypothetical protein